MKKVKKQTENTNELLLKNEIIGIILLFLSIYMLFCLVGYHPGDPSFFSNTPYQAVHNFGGRVGAEIAAALFSLFGFGSYVILAYIFFITTFFLINRRIENMVTKGLGYLLLLLSFSAFMANLVSVVPVAGDEIKSGGVIGYLVDDFLSGQITAAFSLVFCFLSMMISLVLIARFSLKRIAVFLGKLLAKGTLVFGRWLKTRLEEYQEKRRQKKLEEKHKKDTVIEERAEEPAWDMGKETPKGHSSPDWATDKNWDIGGKEKKRVIKEPSKIPEESYLFSDIADKAAVGQNYQSPPLTYLDAPSEKSQIDYRELEDKKVELGRRLEEFRIRGSIVEYTPGPVITTYEFVPDTGVKVKDVTSMSEDLALVAKAQYVRIERILGKKAIGIEIPNKKREIIHLREIIESPEYQQSRSPLTYAMGKTKSGEIFITDLREMPHLIIAGATGSGKSVAIHALILSIIYKASPDEVKLVLIDPKRVELTIYNSLPHLLTPVVVNTKLAKNALDWSVFEMEQRYKKLALLQVRNIEQYNRKLELLLQTEDEALEKLEDKEKIPYIVLVIDEFADLMMECCREIESNVARIAQKARAVGIHLILATQRPSIDVITGTIKNNFPSRIALAVPSKHDSRTIIDVMGAEKLLGNGDMLFLPPKTASLIRLHSAYVSEEESLRVVNYLAKTARPRFNTAVVKPVARLDDEGEEIDEENALTDVDAMFYDAAEFIVNTGQASASFLQRKMSIGYARAGRLMDQLELRGVVSPPDNRNKREVLMTLDQLKEIQEHCETG